MIIPEQLQDEFNAIVTDAWYQLYYEAAENNGDFNGDLLNIDNTGDEARTTLQLPLDIFAPLAVQTALCKMRGGK